MQTRTNHTTDAKPAISKGLVRLGTLAALPLMLSSCLVLEVMPDTVGNGISTTEARTLPSFERVRLEAPLHVVVKEGSRYEAYVTTDDNLVDYVTTESWNGTLTVGLSNTISPSIEPEITIEVPDLRSIVHNGSGTIDVYEDGNFPDLDLTLNGTGEIRFSGTADRLSATVNGAGVIDLEGFAASLEASLRGDGAIHAENLLVEAADVELSGSGFVFLDLDYGSSLDLALTGSGTVEWWGSPARTDYHLSGEGKVIEHKGYPKRSAASKRAGALAKTGASNGGYSEVPLRTAAPIPFRKAAGK